MIFVQHLKWSTLSFVFLAQTGRVIFEEEVHDLVIRPPAAHLHKIKMDRQITLSICLSDGFGVVLDESFENL